jgi:hypothetical protein
VHSLSVPPSVVVAERVDTVLEQPFTTGSMQVLEVSSGDNHPVQQLLELGSRLAFEIGYLLLIAEPLC